METELVTLRKLTENDYDALRNMQTGLEDDYVVRIFHNLLERENNVMYGLFDQERMIAVSGYTLFSNKFAMLGRLRTDIRYRGKGYGTEILRAIIEELRMIPSIEFVSANTQLHNYSARKALTKLDLPHVTTLHPFILKDPHLVMSTPGEVWDTVNTIEEKRSFLQSLKENALGAFPYEAYYPLPFDESLFTDEYLKDGTFYINSDRSRFLFCKVDQKGNLYLNCKYFWNDHFKQPGLFETIQYEWAKHEDVYGAWMDVSSEVATTFSSDAFETQDPWLLYGFRLS